MSQSKVLDIIKKHKRFLISTHVNPDPDALACELAMALYLKKLGKQAVIINADDIPKRYQFLPGFNAVKKFNKNRKPAFDVAVIVDCGDFGRIGLVKDLIGPQHKIINIDHHVTNENFGDYNLVSPEASSTAEVIYDLLKKARFKLEKRMALLLYLGIMSDTGSFRYENTSAYTHKVVSDLMRFPFSVAKYYSLLYESMPINDLKNFAKVVNGFENYQKGEVLCVILKKNVLRKFSREFDLRDTIFRYLRSIKGVEVIVVLTEMGKARTRINLRSQSRVNVARIAKANGGGGHRRASGCLINDNIQSTKRKILAQIRKSL